MSNVAATGSELTRQRRLESPTRPAVELSASLGWFASGVLLLLLSFVGLVPDRLLWFVSALLAALALWRGAQYIKVFERRARLFIYPFSFIAPLDLESARDGHAGLFLGYGFRWLGHQAQSVHDIDLVGGAEKIRPPRMFLALWRRVYAPTATVRDLRNPEQVGESWIHGLGGERNIIISEKAAEGNTLILGVTGAGKTTLAKLLAAQAIHNGNVVIALDPKGDKDFEQHLRYEAKLAGKPYVYFHPAHARESVRLSPLSQWHRPTEIASRVAALLPSESGSDSFTAFGWMTIETVVNGVLLLNQQPTLVDLKKYIQWGPDKLLESVLTVWFDQCAPEWQTHIHTVMSEPKSGGGRRAAPPTRMEVMVQFYRESDLVRASSEIDSLISMTLHNREHYSKMNAALLPILDMLTAGDLSALLSPIPESDLSDPRPIWDMSRVIQQRAVCYIGLDTLSDSVVGSALGSLLNAELASVAGAIYNWVPKNEMRTISIFDDEVAETLNEPLIQQVNKGRGAKFRIYAMAQTIADLPAKLGDESKGKMFAGNFNNLIVLRSRDKDTQAYCSDLFGVTQIQTVQSQHSVVAGTKEAGVHFAGSVGEGAQFRESELLHPSLLGQLPNFNFFALIGGQGYQGRVPMLDPIGSNTK